MLEEILKEIQKSLFLDDEDMKVSSDHGVTFTLHSSTNGSFTVYVEIYYDEDENPKDVANNVLEEVILNRDWHQENEANNIETYGLNNLKLYGDRFLAIDQFLKEHGR